jgi:hypothetical protein
MMNLLAHMNFSSLPEAAARTSAGRGATWRKRLVAGLLGLGAGLSLFAAEAAAKAKPEMHVFTDQAGYSLTAQIVEVAEPDVYLSRADGIPFRVKISVFSNADQQYIRQWAQTHPTRAAFGISIAPDQISPANPDGTPAPSGMSYGYKLILNNQAGADLTDLNIRYIIFKRLPGASKDFGLLPRQNGIIKVDTIAADANLTLETDRLAAAPLGLWLRIYDHNGRLLQELASPPEIINQVTWDPSDSSAPHSKVDSADAANPPNPANPSNNRTPATGNKPGGNFAKIPTPASRPAH